MGTVVESDDCTKRFIHVFDATKQESFYIGICNEWFRLKYREFKMRTPEIPYDNGLIQRAILQDIIVSKSGYNSEHTKGYFGMGQSRFFQEYVTFPICDRPYLVASVRIDKALEYISKMGRAHLHGSLDIGHYRMFYSRIIEVLSHNINRALEYAKYKKYHKIAGGLKYRLLKGFAQDAIDDEFIAELTDFMIAMINQK